MIQLHVITKGTEMVTNITEFLLNNNLVIGLTVRDSKSSYKNKSEQIEVLKTSLLIGITKANLFNTIERLLNDKYHENILEIYAMPIVNMDFRHLNKLSSDSTVLIEK